MKAVEGAAYPQLHRALQVQHRRGEWNPLGDCDFASVIARMPLTHGRRRKWHPYQKSIRRREHGCRADRYDGADRADRSGSAAKPGHRELGRPSRIDRLMVVLRLSEPQRPPQPAIDRTTRLQNHHTSGYLSGRMIIFRGLRKPRLCMIELYLPGICPHHGTEAPQILRGRR